MRRYAVAIALVILSLAVLSAVPAMGGDGDGATDVRVEFYRHYGDAEPYWYYVTDGPVTKITIAPGLPPGADHWELNGKEVAENTYLDEPCYSNPVKIYAVYTSSGPSSGSSGDGGASMLYLGLGMVIVIAMLAYIIVVRMDLAKVCRKKRGGPGPLPFPFPFPFQLPWADSILLVLDARSIDASTPQVYSVVHSG